jgi:nicotinamidase/pyrazinamidase
MKVKTFPLVSNHAALLVVDMQPDFMPGGGLPVEGGDELVAPIGRLMASGMFEVIVATQDWHPANHVSFASNHPGRKPFETIELYGQPQTLWPNHCVQGTRGAELHIGLPLERISAIVRKATDPSIDSYSGLRNNWNAAGERPPTGLGGYLIDREVQDVFVCGLARDYCVAWTAEDAQDAGFRVWVIWDLCRSIDPSSDATLRKSLEERGIEIVSADQFYLSKL